MSPDLLLCAISDGQSNVWVKQNFQLNVRALVMIAADLESLRSFSFIKVTQSFNSNCGKFVRRCCCDIFATRHWRTIPINYFFLLFFACCIIKFFYNLVFFFILFPLINYKLGLIKYASISFIIFFNFLATRADFPQIIFLIFHFRELLSLFLLSVHVVAWHWALSFILARKILSSCQFYKP